ncbi:MAG: hypothetical protein AAF675_18730 [Pseudomonadota bacterium]
MGRAVGERDDDVERTRRPALRAILRPLGAGVEQDCLSRGFPLYALALAGDLDVGGRLLGRGGLGGGEPALRLGDSSLSPSPRPSLRRPSVWPGIQGR